MDTSLQQEINALHAEICAALADPKRITILYALADGPRHVTDLARIVGMPQPLVSRQLKLLRERGMVTTHREGQAVEYRLADRRLIEALDLLRGVLRDHLAQRAGLIEKLVKPRSSHS